MKTINHTTKDQWMLIPLIGYDNKLKSIYFAFLCFAVEFSFKK